MPDKNRKSFDLNIPEGMKNAGRAPDSDLARELLKLIAIGVVGGISLITGAKKFGEELQGKQEEAAKKAEEQREKYKEAVRQAVANEVEPEYEAQREEDDIFLKPSPLEEQPESVDALLEAAARKE